MFWLLHSQSAFCHMDQVVINCVFLFLKCRKIQTLVLYNYSLTHIVCSSWTILALGHYCMDLAVLGLYCHNLVPKIPSIIILWDQDWVPYTVCIIIWLYNVMHVLLYNVFSGRGRGVTGAIIAYLPTLPVFPGVSKFFMKSPGLPVRAPNLPRTTYRGSFTFLIH